MKVCLFEEKFSPILQEMGYGCVRVLFRGGASPTLQLMIERLDEKSVAIEDCTRVTRRVLDFLEEDDPIGGDYNVEVSSPGLDRPLVKRQDFERFVGSLIKVSSHRSIEGTKKFQGKILGVKDDLLILESSDGREISLPLSTINKANLVISL